LIPPLINVVFHLERHGATITLLEVYFVDILRFSPRRFVTMPVFCAATLHF